MKSDGMTVTMRMHKCETNGFWIGKVLEVPGAMSQAASQEELIENLRKAVKTVFAYHKSKTTPSSVLNNRNTTVEGQYQLA